MDKLERVSTPSWGKKTVNNRWKTFFLWCNSVFLNYLHHNKLLFPPHISHPFGNWKKHLQPSRNAEKKSGLPLVWLLEVNLRLKYHFRADIITNVELKQDIPESVKIMNMWPVVQFFFQPGHFYWSNAYVVLENTKKESFKVSILLGNKVLCTLYPYPACKSGAECLVGSHYWGLGKES